MNLLLIENDANICAMIKITLEKQQTFHVDVALTAYQGRAQMESSRPDAIIIDQRLPDHDGIDFCRWVRRNPDWTGIPILFIGSASNAKESLETYDAGVDYYLPKPCDPSDVFARVRKWMPVPKIS